MSARDMGATIGHPKLGSQLRQWVNRFPGLDIEVSVQPMTRTVLKVILLISPTFEWHDRTHGTVEPFHIWVEDSANEHLYHSEYFLLDKKKAMEREPQKLVFTIPIFEPIPAQYYVHALSDRWLHSELIVPISLKDIVLPDQYSIHTNLLDLHPLPTTALKNEKWQGLYPFAHFNPIQTQVFHTMFHTDHNVLLGAPTGSGKTICAEIAMYKVFRDTPKQKVVYIGPLKALVRERLKDWKDKFGKRLGKTVTELTGDYTPNMQALQRSDIVLTTPEKWDGISRNWQSRSYVTAVGLIILDEIHLLGEDRGPILEVIVSRMRYISSQTERPVRFVGLSTALANPRDLADWLGIEKVGLFNFHPSLRPVPIVAHLQGFPGQHYCPRMATMNKPTYQAIQVHSPSKPVLVFVSSRRQTRLTAQDLIALIANENPKRFVHMDERELDEAIIPRIRDAALRETLPFGIGLHHAGLTDGDKDIVEDLFGQAKIQVLISTSTLAWGVNLPAHLVIIKGTEFYDPKTKTYVDFPITDVLQMMGRAGRPQFDTEGKAVVMVHEPKKNFYKKFLYEPFPVESYLGHVLPDHLNAEIVSGTIASKQDAIDYLTWTYYFRRLLQNPNYYGLEDSKVPTINTFLSEKVDSVLNELSAAGVVEIDEEALAPTALGSIASYYYLSHKTMRWFSQSIMPDNDIPALLRVLCNTAEYEEIPVRHNEDSINATLAPLVPWKVDQRTLDSPHTKTNLLFQAHFAHLAMPISDYITDTKTVLDSSIRILQSMVDVAADAGYLFTTLNTMHLMQMILQGCWFTDSTLLTLPHFSPSLVKALAAAGCECLPQLLGRERSDLEKLLKAHLSPNKIKDVANVLGHLPLLRMSHSLAQPKLRQRRKAKKAQKEEEDEENDHPREEQEDEDENQILVKVELARSTPCRKEGAHIPRYPKKKDEGCWLLIGNPKSGDLLALRRIRFQNQLTKATLSFDADADTSDLCLYLMWDCYIGLDQQVQLHKG